MASLQSVWQDAQCRPLSAPALQPPSGNYEIRGFFSPGERNVLLSRSKSGGEYYRMSPRWKGGGTQSKSSGWAESKPGLNTESIITTKSGVHLETSGSVDTSDSEPLRFSYCPPPLSLPPSLSLTPPLSYPPSLSLPPSLPLTLCLSLSLPPSPGSFRAGGYERSDSTP